MGKCGKSEQKIPESLDTACFRGIFLLKKFLKKFKKMLAIDSKVWYSIQACYIIM